jgi:hypothetical protein
MKYKILKPFWISYREEGCKGSQQYRPNWDTEFKADEFSPSYVDWLIEEGYIEKVKNKRWRAEVNGEYWYLDPEGAVAKTFEKVWGIDKWKYITGNYFKTEEEAEEYKEAIETESELRELADWEDEECYFKLILAMNQIGFWVYPTDQIMARDIRFQSEESARQAVEKVGEERVKKYLSYKF